MFRHRGCTSKSGGDQDGWKRTGTLLELSNNSINVLKMMGTGAMAHTVMNTMNAVKVTPSMIPAFLNEASLGDDIDMLPMEFTPSTDVISMLMTEYNAARLANRQAFTYFLLTDDAFQPPWLPAEAIGGIMHFIKEDLILATDNQKKDALTMFNGLNKAFEKTRFFRKREHWMLAWTRILPALLASRQWTLVAWMVHLDHICKLYELNKNRGNDYLVTLYEDRLRRHFHDRCARGEAIDLVAECGKTNENVMDTCKTKLQAVLQAAGLQDTSTQAALCLIRPCGFCCSKAAGDVGRREQKAAKPVERHEAKGGFLRQEGAGSPAVATELLCRQVHQKLEFQQQKPRQRQRQAHPSASTAVVQ